MRTSLCSAALLLVLALSVVASQDEQGGGNDSARAVIREMNLARQNPALYAGFIRDLRSRMTGNAMVLPGGTRIRTKEGTRALDEAIRFLENSQPLPAFVFSPGMSRAAADHCADQANGGFGHEGKNGSHAGQRIARYGRWSGAWGENVSYGKSSARDVVLALIIDDGLPARKHRQNIFNAGFGYAGAAFGRHARFGTVCSMDFAGAYAERGQESIDTLVARNF
ncbi:MAG TPA: CAP domain-containing protein [Chthoniobacterales bacterium]|nr:CAP domain-containing protein [Chthoniobacterales bacterium]